MLKTIVTEQQQQKITFPCIMKGIDTGSIVLFTDWDTGILLATDDETRINLYYYGDDWITERFQPFYGEILITSTKENSLCET